MINASLSYRVLLEIWLFDTLPIKLGDLASFDARRLDTPLEC